MFGFGKGPAQYFELIDRLEEFQALDCPVMVEHSQKSMFEIIDNQGPDWLFPALSVTTMAVERSANIIRVHDVPENATILQTVETARRRQ